MLRTPQSVNGFRRLAETHYGFGDFCVESSGCEVVLALRSTNWRRCLYIAAALGACSSAVIFSMNWPTPSSLHHNTISVLVGLLISAYPILIPTVRHLATPDPWLRADLAERTVTILDFRAIGRFEKIRRAIGVYGLDRPPQRTISFSFDEIVGFCDVLEEFWDSYCELQIVLKNNGKKKCVLVAESGYSDSYKTHRNDFTPLARKLASEIGVSHYSINLSRASLVVNGEPVTQTKTHRLPL